MFQPKNRKAYMSITAFQNACNTHNIATSACKTIANNFLPVDPEYSETTRMIVRFWGNNGAQFSFHQANQDGSLVFDPQNKEITFPNNEQLQKLDQTVQNCISKLLICLEDEILPITKERVITILGDTVVKLQTEASSSSQTI